MDDFNHFMQWHSPFASNDYAKTPHFSPRSRQEVVPLIPDSPIELKNLVNADQNLLTGGEALTIFYNRFFSRIVSEDFFSKTGIINRTV